MKRMGFGLAAMLLAACIGNIGGGTPGGGEAVAVDTEALIWLTGARRMTRAEYAATVEDLLGVTPSPELLTRLPVDTSEDVFGNDFREQYATLAAVKEYESAAEELAELALGDGVPYQERVSRMGCAPAGADDEQCLETFIESLGLRGLRRPLEVDEIVGFASLSTLARGEGDARIFAAARLAVRAMLQHPRFLYRVEVGVAIEEDPMIRRIDAFEVAARLAYALTGTTPDEPLLNAARAGALDTPDGLRAEATRLLEGPQGRAHVQQFFALWLGYADMAVGEGEAEIAALMREETEALISRYVLDEGRPWSEIFTADGTFVNDKLAAHYGLPAPGTDELTWTPYADSRAGLLSHGTFLANGRRADDTSVVARGIFVRERLLCQDIPPPPPNVDADALPERTVDAPCKIDASRGRQDGGDICANCHKKIDPIGFGLEAYDGLGQFREVEPEYPECEIRGDGKVMPLGPFNGPGGLGRLLAGTQDLNDCMVKQLFTFLAGHEPVAEERDGLADLMSAFHAGEGNFVTLMLDLVTSDNFAYRRLEKETDR